MNINIAPNTADLALHIAIELERLPGATHDADAKVLSLAALRAGVSAGELLRAVNWCVEQQLHPDPSAFTTPPADVELAERER